MKTMKAIADAARMIASTVLAALLAVVVLMCVIYAYYRMQGMYAIIGMAAVGGVSYAFHRVFSGNRPSA